MLQQTYVRPFQASIAKLETSVAIYGDKLELKVFGFNDKLPILLSKLLATAKSFMPSEDRFKVYGIIYSWILGDRS